MRILIVLLLQLIFLPSTHGEVKITAQCTEYPPYWYHKNGQLSGHAVSFTRAIMDASKIPYSLETKPWKRVYFEGTNEENVLITCLGRNISREKLFKWVGPMTEDSWVSFIGIKKKNYLLKNLSDVANHTLVVERGSFTEQFLGSKPEIFAKEKIETVAEQMQIVQMLKGNRVDLTLFQEKPFFDLVEKASLNPEDFTVYHQAFAIAEYLAFSKKTKDSIVKKVRKSYDHLIKTGAIKRK